MAAVDIEGAKQKIHALIRKYDRVKTEGRISKFNEENTKAEFIEPLFEALGWDVRNTYHPDEVTREEKISKDRVDYSFRINGIPKFFLEAKALRENLDKRFAIEWEIKRIIKGDAKGLRPNGFDEVRMENDFEEVMVGDDSKVSQGIASEYINLARSAAIIQLLYDVYAA